MTRDGIVYGFAFVEPEMAIAWGEMSADEKREARANTDAQNALAADTAYTFLKSYGAGEPTNCAICGAEITAHGPEPKSRVPCELVLVVPFGGKPASAAFAGGLCRACAEKPLPEKLAEARRSAGKRLGTGLLPLPEGRA
jgi:hypothetical protein